MNSLAQLTLTITINKHKQPNLSGIPQKQDEIIKLSTNHQKAQKNSEPFLMYKEKKNLIPK